MTTKTIPYIMQCCYRSPRGKPRGPTRRRAKDVQWYYWKFAATMMDPYNGNGMLGKLAMDFHSKSMLKRY